MRSFWMMARIWEGLRSLNVSLRCSLSLSSAESVIGSLGSFGGLRRTLLLVALGDGAGAGAGAIEAGESVSLLSKIALQLAMVVKS